MDRRDDFLIMLVLIDANKRDVRALDLTVFVLAAVNHVTVPGPQETACLCWTPPDPFLTPSLEFTAHAEQKTLAHPPLQASDHSARV